MKESPTLAVYAGTFDPVTNGHIEVLRRALQLFDKIVVAVSAAEHKTSLFSVAEREALIRQVIAEFPQELSSRVEVSNFKGLLVDTVRQLGAQAIIRGLRAVSDYEYEAQMAVMNRRLAPDIETVFLMTSEHCSFISSSIVREAARHGGNVAELVPGVVGTALKSKFTK